MHNQLILYLNVLIKCDILKTLKVFLVEYIHMHIGYFNKYVLKVKIKLSSSPVNQIKINC